jgi:hypothetical protein
MTSAPAASRVFNASAVVDKSGSPASAVHLSDEQQATCHTYVTWPTRFRNQLRSQTVLDRQRLPPSVRLGNDDTSHCCQETKLTARATSNTPPGTRGTFKICFTTLSTCFKPQLVLHSPAERDSNVFEHESSVHQDAHEKTS